MVQTKKLTTRAVEGLRKKRQKKQRVSKARMKKRKYNKKELDQRKLKVAINQNIERIMAKRLERASRFSVNKKALGVVKALPKSELLTKGKKNVRKTADDDD
ncbi:uncharacterized protein AMSG_09007 [Thecamonas trahens ATCC 50062]|uniref:Uncharacterized protein n=1 Tax=Thecamonas trahens ATCC 50062 TaxID=461836 RepID=A0A0L0DKL9_THETB|nr:hypothetical protein AMSG_09007 [Thecamonas trahens ATCC 50062]KNC52857.1 hypothetical protein AMSG_09007 [Thecamonas trahens ATCC 50062]|eukprot:XP_013754959.1 hypothetical protein AMSG_09007 [Thecamonas trahens ATCC 50062]